jgi:hypothetical protein
MDPDDRWPEIKACQAKKVLKKKRLVSKRKPSPRDEDYESDYCLEATFLPRKPLTSDEHDMMSQEQVDEHERILTIQEKASKAKKRPVRPQPSPLTSAGIELVTKQLANSYNGSKAPEKAACNRTEPKMDMSKNDPRFTRLSDMLAVNKVSAARKPCIKESNISGKIIVLRGMLMTIEVPVELPDKSQSSAVAFLDSGAQRSFIAAAYAKKLGLKPIRKEKVAITGFDRKTSRLDANIYKLKLASEETIEVEIIEIDEVVGRLTRLDDSTTMEELKQPVLPARKFNCVEPDLLLGMDEFAEIVQERVTKLASGFAMYQTKLGPMVCGRGSVDGIPKDVVASSMTVLPKNLLLRWLRQC